MQSLPRYSKEKEIFAMLDDICISNKQNSLSMSSNINGDGADVTFTPPTWLSAEFQSPLYSIASILVSEIQTPLYSMRAIRVSKFRTLLYSIASYKGVRISDTVIFYCELYGCLNFRHPCILLRAIPYSLQ